MHVMVLSAHMGTLLLAGASVGVLLALLGGWVRVRREVREFRWRLADPERRTLREHWWYHKQRVRRARVLAGTGLVLFLGSSLGLALTSASAPI